MLIAICADSHDNLANIDKFLLFCQNNNIRTILHAGDWCDAETLRHFHEHFTGKIIGVFGNAVIEPNAFIKQAKDCSFDIIKGTQKFTLDGRRFAITHYPPRAKYLAETENFDYVFYGHNHKPWLEKIHGALVANPGTLAGLFQRASFATLDTTSGELKLIIVDTLK